MKTHIITILIFVLAVALFNANAQDPQFSQFYSAPLYLSPSLSGATEQTRITANFRDQWPNLPHSFITYSLSFDHYLPQYKSGFGLMLLRNQEGGAYSTTYTSLLYSYTFKINREWKIRPGLSASYFIRDIDHSALLFGDALTRNSETSIEIPDQTKVNHYDFASSILVYSTNYWFGFTSDHLLAINQQFADDDTYPSMKFMIYGGARFKLYRSSLSKLEKSYTVTFLHKTQSGLHQLDLGTYYEQAPFRIGLWFRGVPVFQGSADLNAIVLLLGYTYNNFMINYSYDISTSRLLANTGGAHEVSLIYKFKIPTTTRKAKMGAVPCPEF